MASSSLKQLVAEAALEYLPEDGVIGVGTGSTVDCFIQLLPKVRNRIKSLVASSQITANRLKQLGFELSDPNSVDQLTLYVDGADEIDAQLRMIKGGGAALTGEKILAALAQRFICIADERKFVPLLGRDYPLPVEVIPLARSYVARELVKLGGVPTYRSGVITDYGNVILDVKYSGIEDPEALETKINQISGVVTNGLFALRRADLLLLGTSKGVISYG